MVLIHTLSHYFVKILMNMFLSGSLFVLRAYVWTHTHKYYGDELPWSFLFCPLSCDSALQSFTVMSLWVMRLIFSPLPFLLVNQVKVRGKGQSDIPTKPKGGSFDDSYVLLGYKKTLAVSDSLSSFSPKHIKSVRIKAFLVFVLLLFCYFPAFPNSFCVFLNYVSLKQCLCEAAWLVSLFLLIIIIHIAAGFPLDTAVFE